MPEKSNAKVSKAYEEYLKNHKTYVSIYQKYVDLDHEDLFMYEHVTEENGNVKTIYREKTEAELVDYLRVKDKQLRESQKFWSINGFDNYFREGNTNNEFSQDKFKNLYYNALKEEYKLHNDHNLDFASFSKFRREFDSKYMMHLAYNIYSGTHTYKNNTKTFSGLNDEELNNLFFNVKKEILTSGVHIFQVSDKEYKDLKSNLYNFILNDEDFIKQYDDIKKRDYSLNGGLQAFVNDEPYSDSDEEEELDEENEKIDEEYVNLAKENKEKIKEILKSIDLPNNTKDSIADRIYNLKKSYYEYYKEKDEIGVIEPKEPVKPKEVKTGMFFGIKKFLNKHFGWFQKDIDSYNDAMEEYNEAMDYYNMEMNDYNDAMNEYNEALNKHQNEIKNYDEKIKSKFTEDIENNLNDCFKMTYNFYRVDEKMEFDNFKQAINVHQADPKLQSSNDEVGPPYDKKADPVVAIDNPKK